jgi:pyruvate-formate lyase-activating enzyme
MNYCRINLSETSYDKIDNWKINSETFNEYNRIYREYCSYKNFESVMPLFPSQCNDVNVEIICYYDDKFVAWDMIRLHDEHNAEALQFAWDYKNPDLKLGIESLKNACAIYKERGFKYLYLGEVAKYKQQINGYEELGNVFC